VSKYAILINSCDNFEDCWQPYFKLHAKYWPDCAGRLYLNTEIKDYIYLGLDIISLKVAIHESARRLTWSECLLRALEKIEEDVVLYMQEDYFLKARVNNDLVEKYVKLMISNNQVDCIHMTDQGPPGTRSTKWDDNLFEVPRIHKDRISCQAALWRKDVLQQYLRPHESGWNFEWFGSKRAALFKHNFFSIDRSLVKLDHFEIIPYLFTGVIGGRWSKGVTALFKENSIVVDYSGRGFFEPRKIKYHARLIAKIKRLPVELKSYCDLLITKNRNAL
jgi:hypothetical protein